MLSLDKKFQFTKVPFTPKSIRDEFRENEFVVVLNDKYCGYTGRVAGYSTDNKKVRVELTEKMTNFPEKVLNKIKGTINLTQETISSGLWGSFHESLTSTLIP